MLYITKVENNVIWKIVQEIRKSLLTNEKEPKCNIQNTLLSNDFVKNNTLRLQGELNINSSMIMKTRKECFDWYCSEVTEPLVISVVPPKTLETAAEMFTYLNYCPPNLIISFYENLFKSASPKDIVLGIISIQKSSQNAWKESSEKIFKKTMESLKLDWYKDIQIITSRIVSNKSKNFSTQNLLSMTDENIMTI